MRLRTYVLLVVLFSLLGLCTVHETTHQTEARYRIAELMREERRLQEDLALLRQEQATLMDPARLERLIREQGMDLRPLPPVSPQALNVQARAMEP